MQHFIILIFILPFLLQSQVENPVYTNNGSITKDLLKSNPDKIICSIVSQQSASSIFNEFQPLFDYLSNQTGIVFEIHTVEDYCGSVNALKSGIAQMAYLGGVTYIKARKVCRIEPLVQPLNENGKPEYYSFTVARISSKIQNVSQLAGKKVCTGAKLSTSGYIVPLLMMKQNGINYQEDCVTSHTNSHEDICKDILMGKCDAAFISSETAKPFLNHGLRIIGSSVALPTYPFVIVNEIGRNTREKIKKAFIALTPEASGKIRFSRNLSSSFKHGFAISNDSNFNELRKMLDIVGEIPDCP